MDPRRRPGNWYQKKGIEADDKTHTYPLFILSRMTTSHRVEIISDKNQYSPIPCFGKESVCRNFKNSYI